MPAFDLRGIRCGKYVNTAGVISYTDHCAVGEAMNVNMELKYAEGRIYSESKLSDFLKLASGGTMSVGVKYLPEEAKELLYGATAGSRQVNSAAVTGTKYSTKDVSNYVGVAFYAPDMIDGAAKYSCVFISKVLFGVPSMVYQTKGDSITFQTPTTTGEFMGDDSAAKSLFETAECDTEADAVAWCKLVLGES